LQNKKLKYKYLPLSYSIRGSGDLPHKAPQVLPLSGMLAAKQLACHPE